MDSRRASARRYDDMAIGIYGPYAGNHVSKVPPNQACSSIATYVASIAVAIVGSSNENRGRRNDAEPRCSSGPKSFAFRLLRSIPFGIGRRWVQLLKEGRYGRANGTRLP
jgi:hypothetical protein